MPIDLAQAKTAKPQTSTVSWNEDQVILYHLGLGAGLAAPTDAGELQYTYEGDLKVLPSFAVVPTFGALAAMTRFPGIDVNFALVLHGEQDVEIHRPIPTAATVENETRLAGVYDKGKAALLVLEVATRLSSGEPLFTNRFSIFARGEGGFGGEAGPKPGNDAPARDPDATLESPTLPNQALLYRLSGDKNPLHADPGFAKLGGFDKPILHGLCTFGVVCKAVVDGLLGGDVTRVARYQVRFAGVVYPGETLVTSAWKDGERIFVAAKTKERGQPVLSNAAITLR